MGDSEHQHERLVAVLGAGKMGEALLNGMIRAGRPVGDIVISERYPDRAEQIRAQYGVSVRTNAEAAADADTLVIAVKPQDMPALLDEIAPVVTSEQLVVSIAAGIPTSTIERRLAPGTPVVRVMSNTAVFVDEAMSVISAGSHARAEHLARVEALLQPVGRTIRLPEAQQDAVTALSGSGPAYFFYLVEAMTDAGILLGLPRQVAHDLIVQTLYGSAVLLRESGQHPVILREAVTSPAGTTISAIRELERHGVRAAFIAALEAARDRGRELATGAP